MKNRLLFLLFFGIIFQATYAQNELYLTGRAYQADSILLRWAPYNSATWNICNNGTYRIERFTLKRKKEPLDIPEKSNELTAELMPIVVWEKLKGGNQYIDLAAQALYGTSFEMKGLSAITSDYERRFSFSLYSADHSFYTAQLLGLGIVDKAVRFGDSYVYRISCHSGNFQSDTAYFAISPDDLIVLPKPLGLKGKRNETKATLEWDNKTYNNTYIDYEVFKSKDGISYQNCTSIGGITFTKSDKNYFQDSLKTQETTLWYKIRGVTIFGDAGPFSEPIKLQNLPEKEPLPNLMEHRFNSDSVLLLFDAPVHDSSIKIQLGPTASGPFKTVAFTANENRCSILKPSSLSYIRLYSYDRVGNSYLLHIPDTIPPFAVQDFTITEHSDSLLLRWSPSSSKDILGYRIFLSKSKKNDINEITHVPITDTIFTLTKPRLTEPTDLFFKVISVDQNHNSDPIGTSANIHINSSWTPALPQINSVLNTSRGVKITWNSTTDPWEYIVLKRLNQSNNTHQIVDPFASEHFYFEDSTVINSTIYTYQLVGRSLIDGNEYANPSQKIQYFNKSSDQSSVTLSAKSNRKLLGIELQWNTPTATSYFVLYKAEGNGPFYQYQKLDQPYFIDQQVQHRKKYRYAVKSISEYQVSNLSNQITLSY